MIIDIDIRTGFGDYEDYKMFKFPDGSIKFELKEVFSDETWDDDWIEGIRIVTTLRSSDDIIALGLVAQQVKYSYGVPIYCYITYMMYQQDDRRFSDTESFGLKFICDILNTYPISKYYIFHPHSDKVEFLDDVEIIDNLEFVKDSISQIRWHDDPTLIPLVWVIPDSGAFKTQFKQIDKLKYPHFITCMKSRNHHTGEIITVVNTEDLRGKDCFIVDDICLGGRTFVAIAEELKRKNCGKLYLIVSHGIFNHGVEQLLEHFDVIYTTNSITTIHGHHRVQVYQLE